MAKERPILFSGPMVNAILAGIKSQTRREMKSRNFEIQVCETSTPPDLRYHEFNYRAGVGRYESGSGPFDLSKPSDQEFALSFCPYSIGDRLWVKETWRPRQIDADGQFRVTYAADGHFRDFYPSEGWNEPKAADRGNVTPLFMPRWASRILLEVTERRLQWLQDISEEDAIAEGSQIAISQFTPPLGGCLTEKTAFANIWKRINGEKSWDSNPPVWVIGFKRVEVTDASA